MAAAKNKAGRGSTHVGAGTSVDWRLHVVKRVQYVTYCTVHWCIKSRWYVIYYYISANIIGLQIDLVGGLLESTK